MSSFSGVVSISLEINNSKNAIKILGGSISKVCEIALPGTEVKRNIVIIKKDKCTSKN